MDRKHEYQTKSRQMILDYLIRNKDRAVHVSDIIRHMDQEECSVNKTTVYRYLDKLGAEKTLMKYVADKGEKAGVQGTRLERVIAFVRLFEARGAQLRSFGRHSGVPRAVSHAAAA